MGIILFLACVGLKAGEHFVPTLLGRDGLVWCAGALAITLVPLLAMGIYARLVLKMNFIVICGLFAGSMTDPPALTFANAITKSDSPSVAYATVYPLPCCCALSSRKRLCSSWPASLVCESEWRQSSRIQIQPAGRVNFLKIGSRSVAIQIMFVNYAESSLEQHGKTSCKLRNKFPLNRTMMLS